MPRKQRRLNLVVSLILVVGFLFRSSMGPAEFLLNMLGEQALCATVLFASALLNVALCFALVPHWGLIGAATATSISLVMAAITSMLGRRIPAAIHTGSTVVVKACSRTWLARTLPPRHRSR